MLTYSILGFARNIETEITVFACQRALTAGGFFGLCSTSAAASMVFSARSGRAVLSAESS